MYCNRCHAVFEKRFAEKDRDGETVCPVCGGDDMSDEVICDLCQNAVSSDDVTQYRMPDNSRVHICKDCIKATMIRYDKLVRKHFDDTEQAVLEGEGLYGDIV